MNAPAMPGGSRTETALAGAVVVLVLLVAAGFLFDLPFGFGGWQMVVVSTPVARAVVALAWVLRAGRRR